MAQDPRALLQKAEKALSSAGGGFSLFGGRTEKYENAVELFTQAANAFRMQNAGSDAGRTFERAAEIQKDKLNEPDDAANTLTDAFKCYKSDTSGQGDEGDNYRNAARCLEQAISHYVTKGNVRRAATHQQNLAKLYEENLKDDRKAMEAFDTAANWFNADQAEALANAAWLKSADLAALEKEYPKAIANYERVAKASISNNLMKWSIKEYLLKAGICHLATNDIVATKRALEQYRDLDNSFAQTREHQLLSDLTEAVEEGSEETFADKLFQYDQMSKLDKWKTTLLLRVKENIEEQGEDFS